jgi:hypothetical protein
MWFWIAAILGTIIGLVLLLAVVGMILPQSHVAGRTIFLRQPPETIWKMITRFEEQPTWHSGLKSIERLPDQEGQPVWKEVLSDGMVLTLRTTESVEPYRMVRRIADDRLPFGGQWVFQIEPAENGSKLTVTEEGEIYNPFFRVFSKFMNPAASIEKYLRDLGKKFDQEVL